MTEKTLADSPQTSAAAGQSVVPDNSETERSAELFRMTLPVITKHGRGFSPVSYTVWYEYVRGENQQLINTLDSAIASTGRISADDTLELYQEHVITRTERNLRESQAGLLSLVDQVDDSVRASTQSVKHLDGQLESFAQAHLDNDTAANDRLSLSGLKADVLSVNATMKELKSDLETTRINVSRLSEELTEARLQAKRDPLTGLLNRRGLDGVLAELINRAALGQSEQEQSLTLILFDIDHFKRVNDGFGHLMGDSVIRGVAKVLDESVMRRDYVSRFGGEEFAVLMPSTHQDNGAMVAERIRHAVSSATFRHGKPGAKAFSVTVSAGVAQFRLGDSASELFDRADQALYKAKNAGRNRVCIGQ
ncbi:MAG: GGDEF domain-containing protein [Burkholderiaceae bacterium]